MGSARALTTDIVMHENIVDGYALGIFVSAVRGADLAGNRLVGTKTEQASIGIWLSECSRIGVRDNQLRGFCGGIRSEQGIAAASPPIL